MMPSIITKACNGAPVFSTMTDAANPEDAAKRWIAAILGGQTPDTAPASVAACVTQAKLDGVAALLYICLCSRPNLPVPDAIMSALAPLHAQAVAIEMLREIQAQRLQSVLLQLDLPFLLLKGAALAHWAYDCAHLRSRDDLDVLFADEASAQRAITSLESLGYQRVGSQFNGPNYEQCLRLDSKDGLTWWVDVHWRMSNHPVFAERFSFQELLERSIVFSENNAVRGLGAVHAFLHAAIHRMSNLLIGSGDRLIWLFDLHQIAHRLHAQDWQQLIEIARVRQLAGPCVSSMDRCTALFSTAWPPLVLGELRALAELERFKVKNAHSRWYFEWQTLRSVPVAMRLSFVLRKVWPARAYMNERYGLTHAHQLPVAYVRRWLTGANIVWHSLTRHP